VVEQNQMLVDVNPRAFHRVARDTGDGLASSCFGAVARNPLRVGESRKSERGTGEQGNRAKGGHGETPGLDPRNLLLGAACA
jgi:hypothetical protein